MVRANTGKKFTGTTLVTSGGGGGGTALTVEEQDGTPSVSNVNTIRVTNGTLTDEGGGVVSITTGGGGGGGSPGGPTGAVQFNNGVTFAGSSQFIYDSTNFRVGIGTTSPARKLDVKETTTQLRLDYDGTEYTDIYSDSAGELQIIPSGGVVIQPTALNSTNRHASYVLDAFTTDATLTNMDLKPGGGDMVLPTNSTWFFDALVIGKQDASTNAITIKLEGCILREAGSAAIQGAVFKFVVHDASAGTWDVDAIASGNNLEIQVTGAAGTTIDWTAHVRTTEVQD